MMYLKKLVVKSCIFIMLISLCCCCSIRHKIYKNEKFTSKVASQIFLKNKNVFIFSYAYANFSYVFTYPSKDSIEWYKIINNKVSSVKRLKSNNNFPLVNDGVDKLDLYDYFECETYDHSYLHLKFYSKDNLVDNVFSIDPDCFVKSASRNTFLKNLKSDIENYKKIDSLLYIKQ